MCQLRHFCYCCRLKTGAIFTSIFTFAYAVGLLVGGALTLDLAYRQHHSWGEHVNAWSQIASGIASLLAFIFLVAAICKRRPGFTVPWLIVAVFDILVQLLVLGLSIHYKRWHNLWIIAFTLWFIYLWIVVSSYRQLLKDRYFPATSSPSHKGQPLWENGRH